MRFRVTTLGLFLVVAGCMERQGDSPRPSPSASGASAGEQTPFAAPSARTSAHEAPAATKERTAQKDAEPVPAPTPRPAAPPADPFGADLDPENDLVVAPPDAIPSCADELTRAGVTFRAAELPLQKNSTGTFTCGANDAVVYQKGPSGLSISPPALMTCRMALAVVRLESLMQEVAQRELGSSIKRLHQMGTYSCRKMVRFNFVSEHSYGNAIDVGSFTLSDGRNISVAKHFGKLDADPPDARARFLRSLGNAAFDQNVVSVSLGPYWDSLHKDHFHFDMARYRVDGSRPTQ